MEEMKNKPTDILTIGSTEVSETKENTPKELSDEEAKKASRAIARKSIILGLKTQLQQLKEYMRLHNLTVEDVYTEIEEKKCNLPSIARQVIKGFKPDALTGYLNDLDACLAEFNHYKRTTKRGYK